jgi:hypothetical protein
MGIALESLDIQTRHVGKKCNSGHDDRGVGLRDEGRNKRVKGGEEGRREEGGAHSERDAPPKCIINKEDQ